MRRRGLVVLVVSAIRRVCRFWSGRGRLPGGAVGRTVHRGLRFSPRTYVSPRSLGFPRSGLEEKSVLVQEGRPRSGEVWTWGGDCVSYGGGGRFSLVSEEMS